MWKQRAVIRFVHVNLLGADLRFGVTSAFQTVHSVISTLAPDISEDTRLTIIGDNKALSIYNTLGNVSYLSIQYYKVCCLESQGD